MRSVASSLWASVQGERVFMRRLNVLARAQEEEHDEHPRLMRDTSADELERRRQMFEDAERDAEV